MRKKILLMLSVFCFIGANVFGQAIEGGAGIIHVSGDPNEIVALNTVTVNEGNVAYNRTDSLLYVYYPLGTDAIGPFPGGTPGTHWKEIDIEGLLDPITSIIVDTDGTPELTATTVAGVTTLSFESDATIAYNSITNALTFTDVDGDPTVVQLDELATIVTAVDNSVTVTTADSITYNVGITGASTIGNAGQVPVTDGAGTLDWTTVVENVTVNSVGQIEITYTDSATPVVLDMSNIPEVANITELNAAAGALAGGTTGLARAANLNTFGLPATSAVGVLFFISN